MVMEYSHVRMETTLQPRYLQRGPILACLQENNQIHTKRNNKERGKEGIPRQRRKKGEGKGRKIKGKSEEVTGMGVRGE